MAFDWWAVYLPIDRLKAKLVTARHLRKCLNYYLRKRARCCAGVGLVPEVVASRLDNAPQHRAYLMRRGLYTGAGKVAIMATVTIRNRSRKVSPEAQQRAERLAATAAAYAPDVAADKVERAERLAAKRAGLTVVLDKRPDVPEQTGSVEGIAVEVRPFRRSDFHSAPDARPMNKADIANVQILTREDVDAINEEFREAAPELFARTRSKIESDGSGLLNAEQRWTLSAYALRKVRREQAAN
jgi:hypothetical protein